MTSGIRFSETMRGPFAMGVEDPIEGEKLGKQGADELRIDVDIEVTDLAQFMADRDASGNIQGIVTYDQIGGRMETGAGIFKLFSPTNDPDTKLMVYELPFMAAGKAHYLSGRKVVHDDPGFDMWSDTTTLFTRLHEGDSAEAPVIGAGVLHIGVRELIAMLRTLEVTGEGGMSTLMTFGRFFFGEVWELFTPRFGSR